MAHTPGPWRFNADLQEVDNITPTLPFGSPRRRVATVHGYDAEYEANAVLIAAAPNLLTFVREVALYSNDPMLAVKATNLYIAIVGKEPMLACQHSWGIPARANNRFGQRSTSLYETRCSTCGHTEVRNGLARLRREVIDA